MGDVSRAQRAANILSDAQALSEKIRQAERRGDLMLLDELLAHHTRLSLSYDAVMAEDPDTRPTRKLHFANGTVWHEIRFRWKHGNSRVNGPRIRLSRPPGSGLLLVAEFLYSRKAYEEVFVPTVSDLREEYAAALVAKRKWKARWVLVRGYWSFFSAAGLQTAVRVARKAFKMWSSAP